MLKNRSMPHSVIIPEIPYPDVRQAVDWLCRCFGFVERLRIGDHRAQLSFADGSLVVTGQGDSLAARYSIMVRVTDVDDHHARTTRLGVSVLNPPTDYPYGERQYTAEDLAGHHWTFSQTIQDVDPSAWGGILYE
ncbi:MAG: glyoxalase [Chloroflexi bacterium]|nr:glyoxalase [Chloroflexota bacterium]